MTQLCNRLIRGLAGISCLVLAMVFLAEGATAQSPFLQIVNPTGSVVDVIAIEGENQTPLATVQPGETFSLPASPGTALGFSADDQWLGDGYLVTGEANETVTLPYITAVTEGTAAAPETQQPVSPEEAAMRDRVQGPGSVEVQFSNSTPDEITASVANESGQAVDLFTIPGGQSVAEGIVPGTQLFFYPSEGTEPVGQGYVVTADAIQALTLPYEPMPPAEPGQTSDPGLLPPPDGGEGLLPPPVEGGEAMLPPATTEETGVSVEITNTTNEEMAAVSGDEQALFTVPVGQVVTHRVPPGTQIWFFPGTSQEAVGKPYKVTAVEGQAISIPYDPSEALRALHNGPDAARVYITNSLKEPVSVAVTDAEGEAVVLHEVPPESLFNDLRFLDGTTLWFYTASSPDPVGDPAVAVKKPVTEQPQVIVLPYKAPSEAQVAMAGAGSVEVSLGNMSSKAYIVAATDKDNNRVDLGTVNGKALGDVRALPGTFLWFYPEGSEEPDPVPYEVTGAATAMISLPYRPGNALTQEYLGTGTDITFANPGNIPVTLALKDEQGKPVELTTIDEGITQTLKVKPRTALFFYKPGMTEACDSPRPFFVPDEPSTVRLPYNPTEEEIARMVGIDLDKIAQEVVNKLVAQRMDANSAKVCWRNTYTRGVGTVPRLCPPGQEEATPGLCYTKCRAGYKGAVTMCIPECPAGWRDDGLYCFKPPPYKRDEYPVSADDFFSFSWLTGNGLQGARDRCRRDHGNNCVTANGGTIVYETCKAGYQQAPIITNLCTPSCPANTIDIGISCQKKTYDRGVGGLMSCAAGQDYDAGLCYDKCRSGFTGVGFVCWADCPKGWKNCGASCAKSNGDCALAVTDQVTSPFIAAGSIALTVLTAGGGSAAASAGKTAAKTGTQIATKTATKAAARIALKTAVRAALKTGAGRLAKGIAVDTAIDTVIGGSITSIVWGSMGLASLDAQKAEMKALGEAVKARMGDMVSDGQIEAVVDTAMAAAEAKAPAGADFPWESLDPTGIADIVRSYNLPLCGDLKLN